MAERFNLFPDLPQHTITTTWGDKQVRLRLTFRDRTSSWYLDIFELDDTPIVLGRRVSPKFAPLLGLGLGGEGVGTLPRDRELVVDGPADPYPRRDLGEVVQLILLTDAEVAAAQAANPPTDLGVTVTVVP
jgi:hypothetical protein